MEKFKSLIFVYNGWRSRKGTAGERGRQWLFWGNWTPNAEVLACADIIAAIISRDSAGQSDVPIFVSKIIDGGQSTHSGTTKFEGLPDCRGLASEDISHFVREIESFEQIRSNQFTCAR
jgi:hypothetical protein